MIQMTYPLPSLYMDYSPDFFRGDFNETFPKQMDFTIYQIKPIKSASIQLYFM